MPTYGPWTDQADVVVDATAALDTAWESRIINSGTTQYDTWATQVSGGFGDAIPRIYDPGGVPVGERIWWLRAPSDPGNPIYVQGVAHSFVLSTNYDLMVSDTSDDPAPTGALWEYEDTYASTPLDRFVQVIADIDVTRAVPFPGATITPEDMPFVAYKSHPSDLAYFGFDVVPLRSSTTGRTSTDVQGLSDRQQATLTGSSVTVSLTFTSADLLSISGHPPTARFEVVPWGYSGDGPPAITGTDDFSGGSAVLRPTLTLTYHRARKRLVTEVIPPLRQWPRDDGLRRNPGRTTATSRQGSLRRGPRGTYT